MHFQEHVEGENCDRCKPGFFNLQQNNPKGCEECFCSGKTNVCTDSHFTYRSVRKILPYQYMPLVLCFCIFSLSIVNRVHLTIKSCVVFLCPIHLVIYRKEKAYKLYLLHCEKILEEVQLNSENFKISYKCHK